VITGSVAWLAALNSENKKPLWVFSIPGKSIKLSSFYNPVQTLTGLTTTGAGATTVTNPAGLFRRDMVGYWLVISAGTNFVAGNYLISSFTSATAVVVASSPTPAGAGAAGVGSVNHVLNGSTLLPILNIPKGPSQKVDELNGRSSISFSEITAIDPSGALKTLSADDEAIGQKCQLFLGFPGLDVNVADEFVVIFTGILSKVGRQANGLMTFTVQDTLVNLADQIFLNGGPATWTQLTANAVVALISSAAGDTRVATIVGWNTTGTALLTEEVTLNGTTEVLSVNTYSELISIVVNVASQKWTVTVKQGSGGTVRGTIPKGSIVVGGPVIPPQAPSYLDNGYPVSDTNPRFMAGNPIDMVMAIMQNEMGVGQSTPPLLVVNTGGGSGTGQTGFGINPSWTFYDGATGLINPNTYLGVTELIALRDEDFANDIFEFEITSTQTGKAFVESQLMKLCGLYFVARADGKLIPKTMKQPNNPTTVTISDRQIIGIPNVARWPVINMVQFQLPPTADDDEDVFITFAQQTSLNTYKAPYVHSISTEGLRLGRGGFARMFLLANRIFNRHAFATPEYTFTTYLKNMVLELGDFITLSHTKLVDLVAGTLGVTSVLCEVTERIPDYSKGQITFKCIDTRFISKSNGAFEIALLADAIPNYPLASAPQKAQYMFISDNNGEYTGAVPANEIL